MACAQHAAISVHEEWSMVTARIRRMLSELQCEPLTRWLCELLAIPEPDQLGDAPGAARTEEEAPLLRA